MVDIVGFVGGGFNIWIVVIALVFMVILTIIGLAWLRNRYPIDVTVRSERMNGGVLMSKAYARMYEENGVRKINLISTKNFRGITLPSPTLDALEIKGNREHLNYWRDVNGNFHQVKFTKFVPIVEFDENGRLLKNLEQEVIFAPDSASYREAGIQELKRLWEKHKAKDWWSQYGPATVIGVIAAVAIMSVLFSAYYISQMTNAYTATAGSVANSLSAIASRLDIIGTIAGK